MSAWFFPVLVPFAAIALIVMGRQRASWWFIPALWPSTQWYYSLMAMPALTPLTAAILAAPVQGGPAVAAIVAAIEIWYGGAGRAAPRRGRTTISRRRRPRTGARPRALVVDRLDRADHQLDAEAVVDQVVAGAAERVGVAGGRSAAGRSPAASASASWGGTSRPVTPSSIISGMPPTFDATTGRDSAIASRIDRPCASR